MPILTIQMTAKNVYIQTVLNPSILGNNSTGELNMGESACWAAIQITTD